MNELTLKMARLEQLLDDLHNYACETYDGDPICDKILITYMHAVGVNMDLENSLYDDEH